MEMDKLTIFSIVGYLIGCNANDCTGPGWEIHGNFCYNYHSRGMTFEEALDHCDKEHSAFLPMPQTQPKLEELRNVMEYSQDSVKTWIGLRKNGNQYFWLDGVPLGYSFWDAINPGFEYFHYIMDKDEGYTWRGVDFDNKERFYCQRLNTAYECPAGWSRPWYSNICYLVLPTAGHTEYEICNVQYQANIAMPKTLPLDLHLTELMKSNNIKNLTLGLKREFGYFWRWNDDTIPSPDDYENWMSGTTFPLFSSSCVTKSESFGYTWRQTPCIPNDKVICQCQLPFVDEVFDPTISYCSVGGMTFPNPNTTAQTAVTSLANIQTATSDLTSAAQESTVYQDTTLIRTESTEISTISNVGQTALSLLPSSSNLATTVPSVACVCSNPSCQILNVTLEDKINSIKANLTVDTSSLSGTIRKLTCAEDQRPSSAFIGYSGGIILGIVGFIILVLDLIPAK